MTKNEGDRDMGMGLDARIVVMVLAGNRIVGRTREIERLFQVSRATATRWRNEALRLAAVCDMVRLDREESFESAVLKVRKIARLLELEIREGEVRK